VSCFPLLPAAKAVMHIRQSWASQVMNTSLWIHQGKKQTHGRLTHHSDIQAIIICLLPPFLPAYHAYTIFNITRILELLVSLVIMRKSDVLLPPLKHHSSPAVMSWYYEGPSLQRATFQEQHVLLQNG
jgi:hypothetical protein